MLTVTIHVTTNQFLNMLIKFQSIKYFLFFRNRTSLSKLKSVNLLRLPDVDSPLVEKTLSIGAVEAGTHKMSQATGAIIGYSLIAFQKLKELTQCFAKMKMMQLCYISKLTLILHDNLASFNAILVEVLIYF